MLAQEMDIGINTGTELPHENKITDPTSVGQVLDIHNNTNDDSFEFLRQQISHSILNEHDDSIFSAAETSASSTIDLLSSAEDGETDFALVGDEEEFDAMLGIEAFEKQQAVY